MSDSEPQLFSLGNGIEFSKDACYLYFKILCEYQGNGFPPDITNGLEITWDPFEALRLGNGASYAATVTSNGPNGPTQRIAEYDTPADIRHVAVVYILARLSDYHSKRELDKIFHASIQDALTNGIFTKYPKLSAALHSYFALDYKPFASHADAVVCTLVIPWLEYSLEPHESYQAEVEAEYLLPQQLYWNVTRDVLHLYFEILDTYVGHSFFPGTSYFTSKKLKMTDYITVKEYPLIAEGSAIAILAEFYDVWDQTNGGDLPSWTNGRYALLNPVREAYDNGSFANHHPLIQEAFTLFFQMDFYGYESKCDEIIRSIVIPWCFFVLQKAKSFSSTSNAS